MANAEESTKAGLSRLQDDARPTICSDSLELISNIAEVGLDEILQNEFLKDIPVISSLVHLQNRKQYPQCASAEEVCVFPR